MKTNSKVAQKNSGLKKNKNRIKGPEKPNFRTKFFPFEKSYNAKNCRRGSEIFQFPLLQSFKKSVSQV